MDWLWFLLCWDVTLELFVSFCRDGVGLGGMWLDVRFTLLSVSTSAPFAVGSVSDSFRGLLSWLDWVALRNFCSVFPVQGATLVVFASFRWGGVGWDVVGLVGVGCGYCVVGSVSDSFRGVLSWLDWVALRIFCSVFPVQGATLVVFASFLWGGVGWDVVGLVGVGCGYCVSSCYCVCFPASSVPIPVGGGVAAAPA